MTEGHKANRVRVLVVDDSSTTRSLLTRLLESDPAIDVVGTATDPYAARLRLIELEPDVMTLDIELPRMDGLSFLERVMTHFPTRTVVVSSHATSRPEIVKRARDAGAVDVLQTPKISHPSEIAKIAAEFVRRVKIAARADLRSDRKSEAVQLNSRHVLAIASSTGGAEALKVVLPALPADIPPTVIVQHMPPGFTRSFAESLSRLCPFEVREAADGDRLLPGVALLAPGDFHMEVRKIGGQLFVKLHQQPLLHGVRPAADFLMRSVAQHAGAHGIGVILTGMGRDGAQGLLAMKNAGGYTLAQNEETSIVFGMPRVAIDLGAARAVLPLDKIANTVARHLRAS